MILAYRVPHSPAQPPDTIALDEADEFEAWQVQSAKRTMATRSSQFIDNFDPAETVAIEDGRSLQGSIVPQMKSAD